MTENSNQSAVSAGFDTDGFVQFPLALLASRDPFPEIMNRCLSYGVWHLLDIAEFGYGHAVDIDDHRPPWPTREKALDFAADAIDVCGVDSSLVARWCHRARKTESKWRDRYGPTCTVRLKTGWLLAMRDEDLNEAQSRCLLGLLSLLGDKDYVKAGFAMIQARAAGWMRPLPKDGRLPPDGMIGPIYTRAQIDYALSKLVNRERLSALTYRRGERWWSHKLTADELADKVIECKTWRVRKKKEQADLNAKVTAAILAARKAAREKEAQS